MEVPLGDTYTFCFTTRAFATGIPTTLAGSPAISVKEEGNDTIITAGVSVDPDTGSVAVTGLNEVTIVASGANGYEAGKYYSAYISTGTVDSVSVVGEVVGHFRMVPAEASAGVKDVNVASIDDIDLSATMKASVNTEADTAITDASLATAANLATVDTVVDAIKVETDKLTFTVANQVDANVQYVNDQVISGTGGVGDRFQGA